MTGLASRAQLRMSFLRYALVAVPAVLLLGIVSGQLAGSGAGNAWFASLDKPAFMPPGAVFGIVWTILYVLLGFVLALLLHAHGARLRGLAIGLFLVQLAANYAWSTIFFALHEVGWAFLLIVLMIALTLALTLLCLRIRLVAALLLLPYLFWLGFAAMLTASIASLNPEGAALAPTGASTDISL